MLLRLEAMHHSVQVLQNLYTQPAERQEMIQWTLLYKASRT
nr:MAG TPA: hypothetical protein [Caudoviricetes sp.]